MIDIYCDCCYAMISMWSHPDAPSIQFMEKHLSVCRGNITPSNSMHPPHSHHPASTVSSSGVKMEMYHPHHPAYGYPHTHPATAYASHMYNNGNPVTVSMHHPTMHSHHHPSGMHPHSHRHPHSLHHAHPYPSQAGGNVMGGNVTGSHHPHSRISDQNAPPNIIVKPEFVMPPNTIPEHLSLILPDDALLLTQYFYYLMLQLQLCHFVETDRKTRGGKRDNIVVGFGGLQCRHCHIRPDARKFFWSDVDRLANSFAEIPNHVLKCRECPEDIKRNLRYLKTLHAEQMAKLPRGSQKVFFRRMWRRIHKDEDQLIENSPSPTAAEEGTDGNSSHQPSTPAEADTLDGLKPPDASGPVSPKNTAVNNASNESRTLLAIDDDKDWLSDMDCFVRRNLEVFTVTPSDLEHANQDLRQPIRLGQVGIRCVHCAKTEAGARGTAVYYPTSIDHVYENVRNFQRYHFDLCVNVPPEVQTELAGLSQCTSLSSVLRRYYVLAAKALGMVDAPYGVRMQQSMEVSIIPGVDNNSGKKRSYGDDVVNQEEKENSPNSSPTNKSSIVSLASPMKRVKQDQDETRSQERTNRTTSKLL